MSAPDIQTRSLIGLSLGDTHLLDHLSWLEGDTIVTRSYFTKGTDPNAIKASDRTALRYIRSVGEGLLVETEGGADIPFGNTQEHAPSPIETDLFEGLNTMLAVRNGESPGIVADWLEHHVTHHGLQAALIIDRSPPKDSEKFARKLTQKTKGLGGLVRVIVLHAPIALGDAGLPPENHPYCAPAAPGKDRMEVPKPAPWTSPLGELLVFEIAKTRFLASARAVANIEVCDLMAPNLGPNVFDRAVTSQSGAIMLAGRRCYPWRVRKKDTAHFSDHICVQFDNKKAKKRWCVAPSVTGDDTVWRLIRVVGADAKVEDTQMFYSFMNLRHRQDNVSAIVPKTSLIEDEYLLAMSQDIWRGNPVRVPEEKIKKKAADDNSAVIVTCMKNEGPFILEWLAYHRMIGVENYIVYTNDCDDGTDTFLDLLQEKGYLQHRDNPFKGTKLKPQHAALAAAEKEDVVKDAAWCISMDVDEFICIHTGDGTLDALFKAVPDANMISLTWRLFGNSEIHEYRDELLTENYLRCAREFANKPHQAWGFKTLFRQNGIFKKLGVHRPKGLRPQLKDSLRWVNGSGEPMPQSTFRNAWRSTSDTYGYGLVSLNHYAVRSAESFLVKRDRGRVNHVDRDQGLAYWFRMNNNEEENTSITRMVPRLKEEMARLLSDPDIKAQHEACVAAHRAKIDALLKTENFQEFYAEITGDRMQRLCRMHKHFGANVFLGGPQTVPDEVVFEDHDDDFFFTVEKQETVH
ncbi:glycosyltransferase family 2 protein [Nereida sp. MMG025]|uniref:glycosyltransferase family 2 protein n=1 Tax=Nereida sp. MMG025 TaxID=2909981 RepID=UPI001F374F20|nr:glycosyltransferase family 2 protein [Nereida sp. MMG025]MCF6445475.1 glycosyltransferase family 2 protein [Nereida sp. MMG025]